MAMYSSPRGPSQHHVPNSGSLCSAVGGRLAHTCKDPAQLWECWPCSALLCLLHGQHCSAVYTGKEVLGGEPLNLATLVQERADAAERDSIAAELQDADALWEQQVARRVGLHNLHIQQQLGA